jgi:Rrf2 family protein
MQYICDYELTPQHFGYKILKKLEKAGFIKIIRGNGGGCRLACDLEQVSLYDLMTIFESKSKISACTKPGYVCQRRIQHDNQCSICDGLCKIEDNLHEELKQHSLAELVGVKRGD